MTVACAPQPSCRCPRLYRAALCWRLSPTAHACRVLILSPSVCRACVPGACVLTHAGGNRRVRREALATRGEPRARTLVHTLACTLAHAHAHIRHTHARTHARTRARAHAHTPRSRMSPRTPRAPCVRTRGCPRCCERVWLHASARLCTRTWRRRSPSSSACVQPLRPPVDPFRARHAAAAPGFLAPPTHPPQWRRVCVAQPRAGRTRTP
jgi:hypothetical protein